MAPRILIFSIAMGADYSFYVKSIATYAPAFLGYNNSVLARVLSLPMDFIFFCVVFVFFKFLKDYHSISVKKHNRNGH